MSKANQAGKKKAAKSSPRQRRKPLKNGDALPEWKSHLDSYRKLVALTFASQKELDAAIGLLWSDELITLPHASPDGKAIIIPVEAVEYFSRAGLKFTEVGVSRMSELSAKEIKALRR